MHIIACKVRLFLYGSMVFSWRISSQLMLTPLCCNSCRLIIAGMHWPVHVLSMCILRSLWSLDYKSEPEGFAPTRIRLIELAWPRPPDFRFERLSRRPPRSGSGSYDSGERRRQPDHGIDVINRMASMDGCCHLIRNLTVSFNQIAPVPRTKGHW